MELSPETHSVVTTELADAQIAADGYEASVQRLLHLLRVHVAMEVAWTSEFVGAQQIFRFVDVAAGKTGPVRGSTAPLSGAYCAKVLAGQMPGLIPDSQADPTAALLDITFELHIGAYLGVPLRAPDGTIDGMLCAISSGPSPALSERDVASARLIAEVIEDLHSRALGAAEAQRRNDRYREEVEVVCAGEGRWAVLQPIVDVATGEAFAAEGLTRFSSASRSPAEWFAIADVVGMRRGLELAAAAAVLARLDEDDPPPAVTVNLSPDLVAAGALDELLSDVDLARVIVEITEHAPVMSYDALYVALEPYRAHGLRVAVDDAGAGYASLAHVLRLRPDLIKIDISLIRGIDSDLARQALVAAMNTFGTDTGAMVIGEGVETAAELATLIGLGVPYAQGYLYGLPTEHPAWSGYASPDFQRTG